MGWIVVALGLLAGCNQIYGLDPTDLKPDPQIEDLDGDLVADAIDNCPSLANPTQNDEDHDTFGDVCDNCPLVGNPDQADIGDGDGVGDRCDAHPINAGDCLRVFDAFDRAIEDGWDVITNGGTATAHAGFVTLAPTPSKGVALIAKGLTGTFDVQVFGFTTVAPGGMFIATTNLSAVQVSLGCGVANQASVDSSVIVDGVATAPIFESFVSPPLGTVALIRLTALDELRQAATSCRIDFGIVRANVVRKRDSTYTTGGPGTLAVTSAADVHGIAIYEYRQDACPAAVWR